MHQTSTGRKAIYIPHSVLAMPLHELASRLAAAVCSLKDSTEGATSDPAADAALHKYAEGVQRLRRVLIAACERGELRSLDPMFHTSCSPDEAGAVVLVDEAARYLATSAVKVRITRHPEALAFIGLHPDELVRLGDVAHLVAQAMHPETDDDEEGVRGYGLTRYETELRINRATVLGELQLVNPRAREALSFYSPDACVRAGDLCTFFGEGHEGAYKPAPEMLPEPVVWNGQTYQPGPHLTDEEVEAARVEVEAIQAAEARSQAREQEAAQERIQRNWWGVSSSYIVSVMLQHQCATAKDLFNKLHQLAGDDSPFERGKDANRGSLFVKDLAKNVSLKTVRNNWGKIKAAAFG